MAYPRHRHHKSVIHSPHQPNCRDRELRRAPNHDVRLPEAYGCGHSGGVHPSVALASTLCWTAKARHSRANARLWRRGGEVGQEREVGLRSILSHSGELVEVELVICLAVLSAGQAKELLRALLAVVLVKKRGAELGDGLRAG